MLTLLILLLVAHALADYPLQGDFLAKAKFGTIPGIPGWYALVADRYLGSAAYSAIEGFDFGEDYEPSARRYWRHIKAKLRKDTTVRPAEWYE